MVDVVDRRKALRSQNTFNRPEEGNVVLQALSVLFKGGEMWLRATARVGIWFKKGATGLPEIQDILGRGILDDQGKAQFAALVGKHDFNSAEVKIRGFSADVQYRRRWVKRTILTATQNAPTARRFRPFQDSKARNKRSKKCWTRLSVNRRLVLKSTKPVGLPRRCRERSLRQVGEDIQFTREEICSLFWPKSRSADRGHCEQG